MCNPHQFWVSFLQESHASLSLAKRDANIVFLVFHEKVSAFSENGQTLLGAPEILHLTLIHVIHYFNRIQWRFFLLQFAFVHCEEKKFSIGIVHTFAHLWTARNYSCAETVHRSQVQSVTDTKIESPFVPVHHDEVSLILQHRWFYWRCRT